MTRYNVVVIALLVALVIPVWAEDQFTVVSGSGPRIAFGTADNVKIPPQIPNGIRDFLAGSGGLNSNGDLEEGVHTFEIQEKRWSEVNLSGASWEPTVFGASTSIGDTQFFLGGQNDTGLVGLGTYQTIQYSAGPGGDIIGVVETHSASGDIPDPRDLFEIGFHPGTGFIYGFGGRTAFGLSYDAFCLDPETGEFFPLPPIPITLSQYGLGVWDRGFVLFFGLTEAPSGAIEVSNKVLSFDAYASAWQEEDPSGDMIESVYFLEATNLNNNKMWGGGGFKADNTPSSQTFIYDVQKSHFSAAAPLTAGLVGFGAGTVPRSATSGLNVQVVGHGGDLGGELSNETWMYTSLERVTPDHVAAATASAPGVGVDFSTQAWVANVGVGPLSFEARLTSRNGADVFDSMVVLPPHTMTYSPFFVRDFFDIVFDIVGGTSFWTSAGNRDDLIGQFRITAEDPSGKQYGQSVEFSDLGIGNDFIQNRKDAMRPSREITPDHRDERLARTVAPLKNATRTGETAYLFTTEDIVSNRVNVGGMAVEAAAVIVTPELPLGNPLAPSRRIELDAGGSFQINNVYDSFDLSSDDANAVISIELESGALVSYGSVLDGNGDYVGTSDPTTIRPVARPGSNQTYLLEIGSITGQGGSRFNGSASILNFDEETAIVQADFFRRGSPGVSTSATLSVPGGGVLGFSDFASEVLGVEGDVGTVRFTTDGGGIAVTGREYSVEVDGGGNVIGTAGQLMRGLTEEDLLEPEQTCHGLGVRQGGGERSHIAFFNPGTSAATVGVSLFNGDGAFEGDRSFTVAGQTLEQFNNIIGQINPSHDGNEKRIEVTVTQPVYGALFRVNQWNDPVTFDFFCRQ
jgi:hypothetical protein